MITNIKSINHGLRVYEFCNLWLTRLGDVKFDTLIKRRSVVAALDRDRYGFQEFCELWYTKLGDKFVTFMTNGIAASFDKKGFKEFCEMSYDNYMYDNPTSGDDKFVNFMIKGVVFEILKFANDIDTYMRKRREHIREEIKRLKEVFKIDTEFQIYEQRAYITELIVIEAFLNRDIQQYNLWRPKLMNFHLELMDIFRDNNEGVTMYFKDDGDGKTFTGEYAFKMYCDDMKNNKEMYDYYEKFCESWEG